MWEELDITINIRSLLIKISMRVFQIINTCGIIFSKPQYWLEFSIIKNALYQYLRGLFLLHRRVVIF